MINSWLKFKLRNNFLLRKKIKEVELLHGMSYIQLREYKNRKFIALFNHAINNTKFYRQYYEEFGININTIKSIDDIKNLPCISKETVRKHYDTIKSAYSLLGSKGYTSGTSGSPLMVYRSYDSILNEQAYLCYFRKMHGIHPSDKVISLRGNLDRSITHRYNKHENTLYLSSYNINSETIALYRDLIIEFTPKAIYAYPSSLEILSNELQKCNTKIHISVAITSSEMLYDFQREKVKNVLGAEIFDWYGNAERTIAIEQAPDMEYYEVPGYAIIEQEDDRLLTTSLINNAFPLIRYEVNDKIVFDQQISSQHSSFINSAKVASIMGREDDVVFLADGTHIGRLDIAFKGVKNIRYAQIHQETVGQITVNVVPMNAPFDKRQLESNLRKLLGDIVIQFNEITFAAIQKSKAGKYKLVINKLKEQSPGSE